MDKTQNILICGVGGQGTVLASKILARAALDAQKTVLSAETIGMAQRGGSVVSHIRIQEGKTPLFSPLIPMGKVNIMLAFEATEAVRNAVYLSKDATVIVSKTIVSPVTASLAGTAFLADDMCSYLARVAKTVLPLDTQKACAALGSDKVTNMLLLGALSSLGFFEKAALENAMLALVKPQFQNLNKAALDYAASLCHADL